MYNPTIPIIRIKDIYVEDVFKWMYDSVMAWSGDGDVTLVCKNYVDAAGMFKQWCLKNKHFSYDYKEYPEDNLVLYINGQECFAFTNIDKYHSFGYTFVIEGDCFGSHHNKDMKLEGVSNES